MLPMTTALVKNSFDAQTGTFRALGWGTWLALSAGCPPLFLAPLAVLAASAVTEGAVALGRSAAEAKRRREAEAAGRVAAEKAEQWRKEEARRREAEERAKPKPPTPAQVRQALRELYVELLAEIDADALMDGTEKAAAKERSRQKYLSRLEERL